MAKKRAFISFDYDNDEGTKIMLAGQANLTDSPFEFKDASVKDHLTGDWKEKIRRKMDNIDVVIVLCGEKTHTATGVAAELEIAQEKKKDYFLLAAYAEIRLALSPHQPSQAISSTNGRGTISKL